MYVIYGNMDPINIPQMLAYIPYMDPMGNTFIIGDVRQIDLVAASHAVGVPERSFLVGKSRSAGFIYTTICI